MSVSACLNFPFDAGSGLFIFNSLNVSSFLIISSVHVSKPHASHFHDSASMSFGPECICIFLSRLTQEYCLVFFSRNHLLHSCPKFLLLVFILSHRPFQWSTSCSVSSDTGLSGSPLAVVFVVTCYGCAQGAHDCQTNQSIISSVGNSVAPFSSVLCFHLFILLFGHLLLIASDHLGDGFQTLQSGGGQACRPRFGRTKTARRDRQRHFPLEPKYVGSNAPRSAISNTLRQSPCC